MSRHGPAGPWPNSYAANPRRPTRTSPLNLLNDEPFFAPGGTNGQQYTSFGTYRDAAVGDENVGLKPVPGSRPLIDPNELKKHLLQKLDLMQGVTRWRALSRLEIEDEVADATAACQSLENNIPLLNAQTLIAKGKLDAKLAALRVVQTDASVAFVTTKYHRPMTRSRRATMTLAGGDDAHKAAEYMNKELMCLTSFTDLFKTGRRLQREKEELALEWERFKANHAAVCAQLPIDKAALISRREELDDPKGLSWKARALSRVIQVEGKPRLKSHIVMELTRNSIQIMDGETKGRGKPRRKNDKGCNEVAAIATLTNDLFVSFGMDKEDPQDIEDCVAASNGVTFVFHHHIRASVSWAYAITFSRQASFNLAGRWDHKVTGGDGTEQVLYSYEFGDNAAKPDANLVTVRAIDYGAKDATNPSAMLSGVPTKARQSLASCNAQAFTKHQAFCNEWQVQIGKDLEQRIYHGDMDARRLQKQLFHMGLQVLAVLAWTLNADLKQKAMSYWNSFGFGLSTWQHVLLSKWIAKYLSYSSSRAQFEGVQALVKRAKILRAAMDGMSVVIGGETYDYRPYRKMEDEDDRLYDLPRSLSHLLQKPFVWGNIVCGFMVMLNFKYTEKLPHAEFLGDRVIHDEGTSEYSHPNKASMLLCRHAKAVLNPHVDKKGNNMSNNDFQDEAYDCCKTLCSPAIVLHGVDRHGLHLPGHSKRCGCRKKRLHGHDNSAFAGLQNSTWIQSKPAWKYPSATGDYSVAMTSTATQRKRQREQIRAIHNGRVP